MELTRCYVSSFGKLRNFSYDFSNGLNSIRQDNGWGKTTFTVFIKSMFYGLNDKKRSLEHNERLKYRPWGSTERFGGYVEFNWKDSKYKIERFFGAKSSDDSVVLTDLTTGKSYPETDIPWGTRIFGIDEEGFLSTIYLNQNALEVSSNSSITAKFNSEIESLDTFEYDRAIDKLSEKIKYYKAQGGKGKIEKIKQEISEINQKLSQSTAYTNTLAQLRQEEKDLTENISKLQVEINEKSDLIVKAGEVEAEKIKEEQRLSLIAKREEHKDKLYRIKNILNGNVVSVDEVREKLNDNNELIKAKAMRDGLIDNVKSFNQSYSDVNASNNASKNISLITGILGVIFAILGGVLLTVFLPISIVLFILGAGLMIFAGVYYVLKNKKSVKEKETFIDYNKNKIESLNVYILGLENRIKAFVFKFKFGGDVDLGVALNNLIQIIDGEKELKVELDKIENSLKGLGERKVDEKYASLNIQSVKNILEEKRREYSYSTQKLASLKVRISSCVDQIDSLELLEDKKTELNEELKTSIEQYNLLVKTKDFLETADENLKIKYRKPLTDSFKKYLSKIIADKSEFADIDIEFNVKMEENGQMKDSAYYSKGYVDIFNICKRFALIDVLFKKEKPFIILDDPFYNLDDDKLVKAVNSINELSNEYQILYMYCHNSRGING